ncbi:MAG: hypothetical protein ACI350_10435 [Prevotella sp.]
MNLTDFMLKNGCFSLTFYVNKSYPVDFQWFKKTLRLGMKKRTGRQKRLIGMLDGRFWKSAENQSVTKMPDFVTL